MHKKLEAELMSIAHQILQLKNKDDVYVLKEKAKEVYEKLSVLSFMDNYFDSTPNATEDKTQLLAKMEQRVVVKPAKIVSEESKVAIVEPKAPVQKEIEQVIVKVSEVKIAEKVEESVVDQKNIEIQTNATLMNEASRIAQKINAIEAKPSIKSLANTEEFKDTIPVDVAANLFEKIKPKEIQKVAPIKVEPVKVPEPVVVKETPKFVSKPVISSTTKTSLNDRLSSQKIQIGLNDRIAFVKHLFNFSQENFNRVLSQLNSFSNEKEARGFIATQVKPDYDWSNKEEYEQRLYTLIERRFL